MAAAGLALLLGGALPAVVPPLMPFADPAESGAIGVSADHAGGTVFLVRVCDLPVSTIRVFAYDNPRTMSLVDFIEYETDDTLGPGMHEITAEDLRSQWSRSDQPFVSGAPYYSVGANDRASTGFVSGLDPTARQVHDLESDEVLVGIAEEDGAQVVDRRTFGETICDGDAVRAG